MIYLLFPAILQAMFSVEERARLPNIDRPFSSQVEIPFLSSGVAIDDTFVLQTGVPFHGPGVILEIFAPSEIPILRSSLVIQHPPMIIRRLNPGAIGNLWIRFGEKGPAEYEKVFIGNDYEIEFIGKQDQVVSLSVKSTHPISTSPLPADQKPREYLRSRGK